MTVRATFKPPPVARVRPVSRAARLLALAHYVERLVEAGEIGSYGAAASALGLTRPRMTQILALTGLRPEVQEAILMGELEVTDHALRPHVKDAEWRMQPPCDAALKA